MNAPKLFVTTPAYNGVTSQYFKSMMALFGALAQRRISATLHVIPGSALIVHARNEQIRAFLESDATHALFVDADIEFSPETVFQMLERRADFVCGAPAKKVYHWDHIQAAAVRGESDLAGAGLEHAVLLMPNGGEVVDGAMDVLGVAAAFWLITRSVATRMIVAHPELGYEEPSGKTSHALFNCLVEARTFYSEDYSFCRRWRALGGKIWLLLDAPLGHIGNHTFKSDPAARQRAEAHR